MLKMFFEWIDYTADAADLVDGWLDDSAVAMTGIDQGWDRYWKEVQADSVNYPGCRDFCKLVSLDGIPIAAVVFGCYRGDAVISEIVVDPSQRSKGYGWQIIRELVTHTDVWFGEKVDKFNAVIFPSNLPSQKAFIQAGFVFDHAHGDGDAWNYVFKFE